jgi:uracil-DNA glycosylase family 4
VRVKPGASRAPASARGRMVRGVAGKAPGTGPVDGFASLDDVERVVVDCDLCPRLRAHCERVARERKREFRDHSYWGRPVPGFGDPRARLLVVGLAPAAHGANRTGRMFTGDSSGSWLYEALHRFGFANQPDSSRRDDGLRLRDCYVTAAARCAPPDNRPARDELERCRPYLEAELRLLGRVEVVVVLGRIAHDAWLRASGTWARGGPRARPQFAHGAEARLPQGLTLLCSYHPSRQNTNTGRLTRPMWHRVFRRVRDILGRG